MDLRRVRLRQLACWYVNRRMQSDVLLYMQEIIEITTGSQMEKDIRIMPLTMEPEIWDMGHDGGGRMYGKKKLFPNQFLELSPSHMLLVKSSILERSNIGV